MFGSFCRILSQDENDNYRVDAVVQLTLYLQMKIYMNIVFGLVHNSLVHLSQTCSKQLPLIFRLFVVHFMIFKATLLINMENFNQCSGTERGIFYVILCDFCLNFVCFLSLCLCWGVVGNYHSMKKCLCTLLCYCSCFLLLQGRAW